MKELTEFVLVRMEPLKSEDDLEVAKEHGVEKFPMVLLLDPSGEKELGMVGDESPEKVAATLREALGR